MAGNVWEWVEDCYHENFAGAPSDGRAWLKEEEGQCDLRVLRGGSWNNTSWSLRSPNRFRYDPVRRNDFIGFRLARDLP